MTRTIRTSWSTEGPQWLVLLAMFALAAWTWPHAPERIPVHWSADGQVDRFAGKVEGLLGIPALALALYVLFRVLPRFDPGRANYATFAGAYNVVRFTVLAILAAAYGWIHLALRGQGSSGAPIVGPLLAGLALVVLGGVLGKVRPNWFVGVRTPWTLSSKKSWVGTHRLAGWLFVLSGLLLWALLLASPSWATRMVPVLIVASAGVSAIYSYVLWRKDPEKLPPLQTLPLDDGHGLNGHDGRA